MRIIWIEDDQIPETRHRRLSGHICVICGNRFTGYGHNPAPLGNNDGGTCCDECNIKVIQQRIQALYK